jgi:MFS transporter, CP family, cyanate transporter
VMPGLIADHLPRYRGLAMGAYATTFAVGVGIAAWIAVPSDHLLGGWRPALAVWGGVAAVTGVCWLVLLPGFRREPTPLADEIETPSELPWRSPIAWWVTLFTTAQFVVGFCSVAAVAPRFVELGLTASKGASYFVVMQMVQTVAMLVLPALTDHWTDRRPMLALGVVCEAVGLALLVVDPLGLALPAVLLLGMGLGAGSALGLILVVDAAPTQTDSVRLGAMTFLVAFTVGGAAPFVLGVLDDATGGSMVGFLLLLAVAVSLLVNVRAHRPGRTIS